jgi:AmiR/NasT family two-component response regulator
VSADDLAQSFRQRELIHQATGVLMQRFGIDANQALKLLLKVSDRSSVPPERLAIRVVTNASPQHDQLASNE